MAQFFTSRVGQGTEIPASQFSTLLLQHLIESGCNKAFFLWTAYKFAMSKYISHLIWMHIFNWAINILLSSSKIPRLIIFSSLVFIEVGALKCRCHKILHFYAYRRQSDKTKHRYSLKWNKEAEFVNMWNIKLVYKYRKK